MNFFNKKKITEPKPAVVTIGDEIVYGESTNLNQQWLLQTLCQRGFPATIALVLPDKIDKISWWLQSLAADDHNPILVSGGIGGTHDDQTRQAIAFALDVELVKHKDCFSILEQKYGERLTSQRQRMAWLPQGCELIPNPIGAPGFFIENIYAFPGFPNMLKPMATQIFDELLPPVPDPIIVVRECILPIAEGEIAAEVEDFSLKHPEILLGIYPDSKKEIPQVMLRLRCRSSETDSIQAFDLLVSKLRTFKRGIIAEDPG